MSELDEVRTMARWVGILFVTAIVLALAVAVTLNLRYKPLGMVTPAEGGRSRIAYIDTWTGEPKICRLNGTAELRLRCWD